MSRDKRGKRPQNPNAPTNDGQADIKMEIGWGRKERGKSRGAICVSILLSILFIFNSNKVKWTRVALLEEKQGARLVTLQAGMSNK